MVNGLQESDIRDLLISTSSRLTSHREFLNLHSAELAPYFNVFDFITPNENRLSDIIAYFLDPKEDHGQGDVFLKSFLENMGLQDKFTNLKDVSVYREQSTEGYRRIDIVIEQNDVFGIGIENKPWAKDQENQLSDYIAHLRDKKYKNNFVCIYLSQEGRDPSKESISLAILEKVLKDKELEKKSFPQFRKWVSEWRNICQSDRVRGFLKDFESYLHHEFEGGSIMSIENTVVDQALSNANNLEAALHIANNVNGIKERLLNQLKVDIENKLKAEKSKLKLVDWGLNLWGKSTFSFREDTWRNHRITFEAGKYQIMEFAFGVSQIEDKKIDSIKHHLGPGENCECWPWYKYFEDPYYDWSSNVEPWIDILIQVPDDKNGKHSKMVEKIFEKVKLLHEGLTKCASEEGIEL